ncbi:glycosyltransferase family 2 protein [Croceiramulus getboli]|nr:glycosyltransferase [Flavobacteriaceae bacterium YJPT1-3]
METLRSIQNQTYADFQCLITDDRSTDNTKEIVERFCKTDERFKYRLKPKSYPSGLSATRNFGLDLAQELNADFIQLFDDDDIMHPLKLELQLMPLLQKDELDMTLCAYRKFKDKEIIQFDLDKANDNSCNVRTNDLLKSFYLNKLSLNSCGPIWRFKTIRKYRFHEDLFYDEERNFYLRILVHEKIQYKPVDEILFWYRKHPLGITSNLYGDKGNQIKKESLRLSHLHFFREVLSLRNPPFYLLKSFSKKAMRNNDVEQIQLLKEHLLKTLWAYDLRKWILLLLISGYRIIIYK